MRFVAGRGRRGGAVAGRGAVAKLLQAGNRWHRGQPAGAVKRNSIGKSLPLHGRRCGCIGKPTSAHKREGPGRDLNISPSRFYLLPCERATCRATRPNRRSPLAFTAGMQCRRSCLWHSPLAFTAGMQCWRSCRCNYAGIARKVAANARIA